MYFFAWLFDLLLEVKPKNLLSFLSRLEKDLMFRENENDQCCYSFLYLINGGGNWYIKVIRSQWVGEQMKQECELIKKDILSLSVWPLHPLHTLEWEHIARF